MTSMRVRGIAVVCLGVLALTTCSSGGSKTAPTPAASTTTTTTISPTKGLIQKIDHLVVLMQENRSYDSYFGKLSPTDPAQSNPNPAEKNGAPLVPFNNANMCESADL